MAHLAIQHNVRDYAAWKRVYDEFAPQRRAAGEISYQVFDVDGDRNNIAILQEWNNLENAKAFVASAELKEAMGKAGVEGEPTIMFLNAGDSGKP